MIIADCGNVGSGGPTHANAVEYQGKCEHELLRKHELLHYRVVANEIEYCIIISKPLALW